MKILVVDDDELTLEAISHHLSNDGHEVIITDNGAKALEIIDHQEPDLIISDIMMPNMSGLTLLSLLKQFYFNRIPVILISTLDKGDVIMSALELGANDFII